MTREMIAKSFKSGNSVALRLPKEAGIGPGEDLIIVPHADGSFSLLKKADSRQSFMRLFGSMSPGFMADGRGDVSQDDYDWQAPSGHPAAA